jgi:glycine C-acetyltransferase
VIQERSQFSGTASFDLTEETSLVDVLRARDGGMRLKDAAAAFKSGLADFAASGRNLYGRILMGASDAEGVVDYPIDGGRRRMIILASNNYLGLSTHPKVVEAAQDAAARYGTGAGSSPLLVGTFTITKELEANLAEFKRCQEVCLFSTGYSANVGVMSALAGKEDLVVLDRLAHASLVDGAKLSGARVKVFRHNDTEHLDHVLRRNSIPGVKLVCVEGIYSMDGDIAPLDEILDVVRRNDALLLVDEAHSTGVLGREGRGIAEHFGLEGQIDLHVGTLSKALGACGGFVAGSSELVTYLRYFARSGMFSTAASPMVTAAANAALEVIRDEPELRERLWDNCGFMHGALRQLGLRLNDAPSPIIPVIVGTMKGLREMTLELHRGDICVNSVPFPAVPHGSERLRISLTANHTREQLSLAVERIAEAARHAGVI